MTPIASERAQGRAVRRPLAVRARTAAAATGQAAVRARTAAPAAARSIAPDGCALIRAFLGGGRDPHRLERSDEELVDTARRALTEVLGIEGEAILTRIFRFTRQSPQYEVGHLDRIAKIEQRLGTVPGVFLAGSGFRAIGIPDCIADGRAMAVRAAAFVAAESAQPK
jgi:oxygen-dependent protoporphyrinogen oxidase